MKHDFGIVIPHLDLSAYLRETLNSVVHQEGDYTVHVHIQDGGVDTEARRILDSVAAGADSRRFYLSYLNDSDHNAADAINKGMAQLDAEVVTWLGADDFLLPGSLQAVYSLRVEHPEIRWITGLPFAVNESGVAIPSYGPAGFFRFPSGYSRSGLRVGLLSDGKNHGTIQQEGTFWEQSLWKDVGGLDTTFTLAFDFDLWCRFAEHATLTEAVLPLAGFRKRPGQASGDFKEYARERFAIQQRQARTHNAKRLFVVDSAPIAFLDSQSHNWKVTSHRYIVWVTGSHIPRISLPRRSTLVYRVAAWLMSQSRQVPLFRRIVSMVSEWRKIQ